LPELSFAFLACPADLEDPKPAIGWLAQAVGQKGRQNAAQFVAVNAKFKAPFGIRTINVGSNYPTELAQLATHANWARSDPSSPPQYRDAKTLFCLHRFTQAHPDVERIVLITEDLGEDYDLTSLLQNLSSGPFHWHGRDQQKAAKTNIGPIVFNRTNPEADTALNLALDIALTGAIYGLDPYSCEALLNQSISAAAIVTRCMPAGENGGKS
jgi:hypothetical protein